MWRVVYTSNMGLMGQMFHKCLNVNKVLVYMIHLLQQAPLLIFLLINRYFQLMDVIY